MADDDATLLKTITDNVEGLYQALRLAAANISGLLQLGTATCDEVRAYNLWAMATFNAQKGMLDTLRANGESGVPDMPTPPTLFTWRGVSGQAALSIDCAGEESSLSGAMKRALRGPTPQSVLLSTNDIVINTTDAFALQPKNSPTFASLFQVQQARAQGGTNGLGFPIVLIVIAGIVIAASVAVVAVMSYLKASSIQESNSKQVRLQAEAFANYTDARLQCQQRCVSGGLDHNSCVKQCADLIGKPNIKLPDEPFSSEWGLLEWTGFTVLLGGVAYIAWRVWERKKAGKPIFQLPDFHGDSHDAA